MESEDHGLEEMTEYDPDINGVKLKSDFPFPSELMELVNFFHQEKAPKVKLSKGEYFTQKVYDRILNLDRLETKFEIDWRRNLDIPHGMQEFGFEVIDNTLIMFCGYTCNHNPPAGRKKYLTRGFSNKVFAHQLGSSSWSVLASFPGQSRQGIRTCMVNNLVYAWGGFTYQPMNQKLLNKIPQNKWPAKKNSRCFTDGYCLNLSNDGAKWSVMPPLPEANTNFGICSDGQRKIFICFGGSYSTGGLMGTDTTYNRLFCLDLEQLDQGWKLLSTCPGSMRINCSMAYLNDQIYVIGGVYPNNTWKYGSLKSRFRTILDNWKYNISKNEWVRLVDNPVETGNWGGNDRIVFQDRYLIVLGGAYFPEMVRDNLIVKQEIKPCLCHRCRISHCACGATFLKQIFAYDTQENKFIKCQQDLPGHMNLPPYKVIGDQIYLMGGESYHVSYQGKKFCAPHLEINLQGTIKLK